MDDSQHDEFQTFDTGIRTDPAGGLHRFEPTPWDDRGVVLGNCSCGYQATRCDVTLADAKATWARHTVRQRADDGGFR